MSPSRLPFVPTAALALAVTAACRPAAPEGPSRPPTKPAPAADVTPATAELSPEGVLGCIADPHEPVAVDGKLVPADSRCGRFAGLPAISRDGRHVVVPVALPQLLDGPAAPTVTTLSLDLVRSSDGKLVRSLPLVTADDHQRIQMPEGDCCEPGEEGCDPHLCEPEPAAEEATEASVVKAIEARIAVANARLAAMQYRPLVAVPGRRVAGRPLWLELDDQDRAYVRDAESGRTLAERDLPLRCARRECEIHSQLAWLDPELSLVVVQVITSSEGADTATATYAAIQLPLPP